MYSKIKVAFDSQIFSAQTYGGVSRYYYELIGELNKKKSFSAILVAPFFINKYVKNIITEGFFFPSICQRLPLKFFGINRRYFINFERLIGIFLSYVYLSVSRPKIIHETYYLPFGIGFSSAIRVLTIYDMIHEIFPELFGDHDLTSSFKRIAVNRADHIICISKATKNDLMKFFGIPEEKISVVYLAPSTNSLRVFSNEVLRLGTRPYLLYVGSRRGYKNFINFLNGYIRSSFLKDNYGIICFGGGEFDFEERKILNQYGLLSDMDSKVKHISGDDLLLGSYYKNASVFVYPSRYEGFGLPPLEAMSHDCPVACSQASSIPEVVGNAASYFDPENVEEITSAIEKILIEPGFREELIKRGRQRLKHFSWEKCATETENVYANLLKD
ncbi:glycosyltransferase family 1 protein [Polynucleobacter sp. UB-Piko-W3]|uniref:glycosyltransferase family 4 protein n=1 Tax=Polynucleobacter sp. UB-Piko-W3 TaxID=1819735 RepID=UPI001C0C381A|nr:glycosyltransferase family 1 protein [Polynucleobacter sp. UB-Piko-W3]MBU3553985.1 glycosyltransferase family 4 protein [Polynucleobacter sp. UB-Piko-W3]